MDRTGDFTWAFAIVAGFALLGAAAWAFIVGPVKQVHWEQTTLRTVHPQILLHPSEQASFKND
jgi:hypothetical protein